MFDFAIETANKQILGEEEFQLKGLAKEITFGNDFEASKNACKLLRVRRTTTECNTCNG